VGGLNVVGCLTLSTNNAPPRRDVVGGRSVPIRTATPTAPDVVTLSVTLSITDLQRGLEWFICGSILVIEVDGFVQPACIATYLFLSPFDAAFGL